MNHRQEHTPGPWGTSGGKGVYAESGREIIFCAHNTRSGSTEEKEANARLIAAAPELLAACQRLLALASEGVRAGDSAQGQAREAITKAIGTQR